MKVVYINNRKAKYEYYIINELECGMVLTGQLVKLIRLNKINLIDSYCHFEGNELFIKNVKVIDYNVSIKLLLNKQELHKFHKQVEQQGYTIIPLSIYDNKTGIIKVKISLCKGKKIYDKKESIKEKDIKRDLERYGK